MAVAGEGENDRTAEPSTAVELNWLRLQQRFALASSGGQRWLVECRDLGDALDADAGVYFVECADEAAVDQMAADRDDTNPYERLLGIYDLRKALHLQGAGLSRAAWLSERSQSQAQPGP